jgi:hypothetical protein
MSYRRWVSLACLCRWRPAHRRQPPVRCRTRRPRIPRRARGSPSPRRRSPTSASARSMSSTRRTSGRRSVNKWPEVAAEVAAAAEVAEAAEAAAEVAAVAAAVAAVAAAACRGAVAPSARPRHSDCVDTCQIARRPGSSGSTRPIVRCLYRAALADAQVVSTSSRKHITRVICALLPAQDGRSDRLRKLRMRVLP